MSSLIVENASNAKSDFLSRMSHEFRTPMNAILGFSQILQLDDNLQSDQKESINEILKAGQHLLDLINEILDLSRIEKGKLELHIEKVDLLRLTNETLALLKPQAHEYNIELVNNLPDNINYLIRADQLRLKQILINLLSNAIKYNYEGGKVYIDSSLTSENQIRISIKDTGAGIPGDMLSRIFIPFERLEQNKQTTEGTGIGLALSKKLVELMDGTIGVDSIPTQGSTFYIEFSRIKTQP